VDFAIPKGVEILQDLTADQGVVIEVLQAAETIADTAKKEAEEVAGGKSFVIVTGVFRLTFDDATPQPIPVTLTIPLADQIALLNKQGLRGYDSEG
jgi:hypothetical protein